MKCETEAGQRERVEVIFCEAGRCRRQLVEHLHHHLNFSVDVKFRQRYYSALVKQNKNPVQIQGLCSDNQ